MTKVLVTGATGKSGKFFINELIKNHEQLKDYSFKFFVRATTDTREIDEAAKLVSVEKFVGDKNDAGDCETFCAGGYDTLLHISSIFDSERIVAAALKNNVRRFILVHTTGIYSKYKAAGEGYRKIDAAVLSMINKAGAVYTILRPTMIYGTLKDGNLSKFIKMVDKLRLFPVVSGGKAALQPVWCGDLGKAYFKVLTHEESTVNKSYNLSGGNEIRLIDMFKEIARQLGVKNTFISCPFWLAYSGAWIIYCLSLTKLDFREKVQRLVEPRVFSHEDAYRDFGYEPLNFEEGIAMEIEMYKKANK